MTATMRIITLVVGLVLIGLGLYQAFVPQEVLNLGPVEVNVKEGLTTESLVLIGLGVLAILVVILKRK